MIDDSTKIEILNDHYKDTFGHIKEYLKLRDRMFIYLLLIVSVILFQIFSPSTANDTISKTLSDKIGLAEPINISFISTIIWFSLLALCIRYFQTVVYIERQYEYIRKIEDNLSSNYSGEIFTREGKSYLKNYPLFSNWTWFVYSFAYPILLLLISSVRIFKEYESFTCHFFIDLVIYIAILISIITYMALLHLKK